jgi:ribosomal subunit interface protein
MTTEIVALDLELTPQTKQVISQKIGKLDKFLTHLPDGEVFVRVALNTDQTNRNWVVAALFVDIAGGPQIQTRGSASSPEHAVHLATINMERQLAEQKERMEPYT